MYSAWKMLYDIMCSGVDKNSTCPYPTLESQAATIKPDGGVPQECLFYDAVRPPPLPPLHPARRSVIVPRLHQPLPRPPYACAGAAMSMRFWSPSSTSVRALCFGTCSMDLMLWRLGRRRWFAACVLPPCMTAAAAARESGAHHDRHLHKRAWRRGLRIEPGHRAPQQPCVAAVCDMAYVWVWL